MVVRRILVSEWPTLIDNPDFDANAVEDANNPRYLKDPDSYIEQLGKGT